MKFFWLTSAMTLLLCIIAVPTTAQENTAELKHSRHPQNQSHPAFDTRPVSIP